MQHKVTIVPCDENAIKLFKQILELARAIDSDGLRKLQEEHTNLNVHNGMMTPIAQLASEGNDKAVDLLISLCGNKGHEYAVFGYAMAGNAAQADAHSVYCPSEGLASRIQGYVFGGKTELARQTLRKNKPDPYLAAKAYLAAAAKKDKNDQDFELMNLLKYLLKFLQVPRLTILIKGAAMEGNLDPYYAADTAENNEENTRAAIEGCIAGSRLSQAIKIAAEKFYPIKNQLNLLMAYAKSGHDCTDHIEKLFNRYAIGHIAYIFARAGNHRFVEALFKAYPDCIADIANGYQDANYLESEPVKLRLLRSIEDPQLRKSLVENKDLPVSLLTEAENRNRFFTSPSANQPKHSAMTAPRSNV